MRISSNMQYKSMIDMKNSDNYKKFVNEGEKKSVDKDNANSKEVTPDISLEKADDKLIISKVSKDNKKEILAEVEASSKLGRDLSKYFESTDSTTLKSKLEDINDKTKTLSLTNYL